MELNEEEKRQLFQVDGDCQAKVLDELYMTARFTRNPEQRDMVRGLMAKLRVLSNEQCMDLVKDIQKNYHLPYPRTMGERIALARQQSGAEKLKGHDIMALERFDPQVRHMVVFDVLSFESPVGDKGDKMRLFLTDEGYRKAMENQERGFIKIQNHAKVHNGYLNYDHKDRDLYERVDELVELMLQTVLSQRPYIRIAGDDYPREVVKSRFLKVNFSHVEYVFDCLDNNTTKVRNIKSYLLAALYNAPTTMDSYYRAEVNHDLYG